MEYDVTGTLKIDTEAFEKALKEAQGKLDKFKKDFQSLNNLSSKNSFKELSESLGEVEKSVQDLKLDFEGLDKSADDVTKSVEDLKKETDNATKSVEKLKSEWKSAYKEVAKIQHDRKRLQKKEDKALEGVGDEEWKKYKEYYYEKGDIPESMKWLDKWKEKRKKIEKEFQPLYDEMGKKEGELNRQIKEYEREIYKLQDSLERIPNSFDKITESSKRSGQSIRQGLLKELQKAEEELRNLYRRYNSRKDKIKSEIPHYIEGEVPAESDYRKKSAIAKDSQLNELRNEINKAKWYIDDLIKEWDKLGEPSQGLDKKISKVEKWTEALREAEMEVARLRVNADTQSSKTNTKDYYKDGRTWAVPTRKELDVIRETLAKYDKSFEKMSLKAKELKEKYSKDGYSRELDKEWDKLDEKTSNRLTKMANEVNKYHKELENATNEVKESSKEYDNVSKSAEKLKEKTEEVNKSSKKTTDTIKTLDEYFDNATASAEKLENETKQVSDAGKKAEQSARSLDEYFDQATASAEKLNAEAKKTSPEIEDQARDWKKVGNELLKAREEAVRLNDVMRSLAWEKSQGRSVSSNKIEQANASFEKQKEVVKQLEMEFAKLQKAGEVPIKVIEPTKELSDINAELEKLRAKSSELFKVLNGFAPFEGSDADLRRMQKEYDKLETQISKLISKKVDLEKGLISSNITEPVDKLREVVFKTTESVGQMNAEVKKTVETSEQLDDFMEKPAKNVEVAEEKLSEFDAKLKQQHEGLDQMLAEDGQKIGETASKVGAKVNEEADKIIAKFREVSKSIQSGLGKSFRNLFYNNKIGTSKWFTEPSPYGQETSRWIHEQLSVTRDFFKGFTQGFAKLKKEQSESVSWMNELQVKMNELKYGSRDFINTEMFAKANSEAKKYLASLGKVSASTNQWVNQEITDFNRFSKAVQTSTMEAENRLKRLEQTFATMSTVGFRNDVGIGQLFSGTGKSQNMKRMLEQQLQYNKMGNATGVGFAGTSQFQNLNKSMQEYNRLSNIANLNTERMGLGFEKFGQYSKKAESSVRSLSGVFRTLRTTLSMIGGMFVWEFAFKIMDSARATISAKSEMESYYKTLNMGSKEIANFNKSLDSTISTYQKMNKFQLGETIASLGVEFKMSTDEMNQVMKVAPMIVNEYLRAGRSTEEAILAIKDISQGEFLRLSRETGVGKKEIKEAGWSGDNKDIISLYQALEKIGKARHWDVFASKATSLNDVMLITENRMTEFATLLSDAVTPIIVGSFNAMGDAFNTASRWYEGLGSYDKAIVQMITLGTAGLSTAGIFNSHLLPAIKNFGTNVISSFLGVDSAIAKEKGLAQAIAHETAVERIANIERKGGQKVLHSKIMTLKAEELANKLGMNTTKLRMRYENLQQVAMKRGTTELKARELAQRSLILAEEQNITTTQAMNILLEEEALAEMGTAKALLVRKLGLDANIVSEEGMVVALNERIAQSFPFISSLVSETLATLGLESATATLVVTLGLMIAPLIAIGVAIAPLIANFLDLQKSYESLSDTFENGQQRIDELEQKQKGYQKTIDELGSKTNLTAEEEAKLQEARDGLTYTTEALEDATKRYNKSVEYTHIVNKNIEKVEGERAKNLKEINKELEKQTGKKETIDSSYGMTTAYKEQYRTLQVIAWEENHRPERFKKLSESIKNTSKDQEEYNKKIQEFGNDWNQAYSDMEDAQLKRIDPNSDAFTRLWSYFDESWAIAKMDWIEFWADPFASISGELGFDGLSQSFNDALTQMGQDWDNFWQPITDFFNNFSVDTDFDPFAGLKDWWSGTNDWLDSIMPDISVDSIKEWVRTHIKEPFQKAVNDFLNNPFGGGDEGNKTQKQGSNAKKSFNWGSMFNFDFNGIKSKFSQGISGAISGASPILKGAGELWSKISNNNGLKVVSSARQGLSGLKQAVTQKFNEGKAVVTSTASSWGKSAYNTGNSIYSNLKTGVGDLGSLIKSKFKGIKEAIDGAKKGISSSVKAIADAITSPLSGLQLPSIGFGGGFYGSRRSVGGRIRMPRVNQPVYGSSPSSMGFDTVLATMLTEQGFRSPSSYQFYPNSQKSVQEAWDTGKANCFDGARVILALASMFGLKGHMVTGTWNGTGHSGAVIGGKLYDMTQFQRRGVFRGTAGVHFGSSAQRTYGAGKQENNKIININVTNDLSNARIYGMDDLDSHIKQATEKTFYELNSMDGAIGY